MKFFLSSIMVLALTVSCSHYSHHSKRDCNDKQCEYSKDGKMKNCQCDVEKKEEAKKD